MSIGRWWVREESRDPLNTDGPVIFPWHTAHSILQVFVSVSYFFVRCATLLHLLPLVQLLSPGMLSHISLANILISGLGEDLYVGSLNTESIIASSTTCNSNKNYTKLTTKNAYIQAGPKAGYTVKLMNFIPTDYMGTHIHSNMQINTVYPLVCHPVYTK